MFYTTSHLYWSCCWISVSKRGQKSFLSGYKSVKLGNMHTFIVNLLWIFSYSSCTRSLKKIPEPFVADATIKVQHFMWLSHPWWAAGNFWPQLWTSSVSHVWIFFFLKFWPHGKDRPSDRFKSFSINIDASVPPAVPQTCCATPVLCSVLVWCAETCERLFTWPQLVYGGQSTPPSRAFFNDGLLCLCSVSESHQHHQRELCPSSDLWLHHAGTYYENGGGQHEGDQHDLHTVPIPAVGEFNAGSHISINHLRGLLYVGLFAAHRWNRLGHQRQWLKVRHTAETPAEIADSAEIWALFLCLSALTANQPRPRFTRCFCSCSKCCSHSQKRKHSKRRLLTTAT